jgi:hypothetical protein
MVEHDGLVGQLLKKLDDLGIAENTIVMYSTDNGAELFGWPDGGYTPYRGEKNSNWEGGYRVPKIFNLRQDPFERMDHESNNYTQWWVEHMFLWRQLFRWGTITGLCLAGSTEGAYTEKWLAKIWQEKSFKKGDLKDDKKNYLYNGEILGAGSKR